MAQGVLVTDAGLIGVSKQIPRTCIADESIREDLIHEVTVAPIVDGRIISVGVEITSKLEETIVCVFTCQVVSDQVAVRPRTDSDTKHVPQ